MYLALEEKIHVANQRQEMGLKTGPSHCEIILIVLLLFWTWDRVPAFLVHGAFLCLNFHAQHDGGVVISHVFPCSLACTGQMDTVPTSTTYLSPSLTPPLLPTLKAPRQSHVAF